MFVYFQFEGIKQENSFLEHHTNIWSDTKTSGMMAQDPVASVVSVAFTQTEISSF
jgi:hypothetical protein